MDPDEALSSSAPPRPTSAEIASWMLATIALFLVLRLHLLAALVGGLAVYEVVHLIAGRLPFMRSGRRGPRRVLAVTLLSTLVIAALVGVILGALAFFRSDQGSLSALLAKMADVLEKSREQLPEWLAIQLPANADELEVSAVAWLREHAGELRTLGTNVGKTLLHALIGMILGALISLHETLARDNPAPLAKALTDRAEMLGEAFRRIVFAQVRISALNTVLTAVYLLLMLPLLGVPLPLAKTLVAVTFVVGLVPVLGNLVSNTFIVIVSLSHSLGAAVGSLAFLVVIHKLEYFLNARIVGTQIKASAWELLLAILLLESAFGLAGVIAAPIYYAFLKMELTARRLI
jgi:predicted PurR-regulated permease PerM